MATFFKDATLVQLDPPQVESGCLRQVDGIIAAVGTKLVAEPDDEVVDCHGAVLMPGLVNGHTHLYSALAVGMPSPPRAPTNFHEILQLIWWRLDRAHSLESVNSSGQVGALAAIRCGTTTLIDHHASPNAIQGSLDALESGIDAVGCRGVLCYETTDRNRSDEAEQGLAENQRYIEARLANSNGRFAGMVGAHASFTLNDASLASCVDLAKKLGVGVHIHVAEDPVDERITRELVGCGLMERFQRQGLLDVAPSIFAHGTHLSTADAAMLKTNGSAITLAHNPNSNMNNGVGYTPVAQIEQPIVLGTDGIGADMWREARTAQFKSNDAGIPLPFGEPLTMIAESSRFASRCLGIQLGTLEVGTVADLVLTDYCGATPLSTENLAGHLIFAMGPEYVRDVMIAGTWCLRDRQVVSCDEAEIRSQAVQVASGLYDRMMQL
ncbi:MAG: amidohydrolase family protein [Bythopirellula sp.]